MNLLREGLPGVRRSHGRVPFGAPEIVLAVLVFIIEFTVSTESVTVASVGCALAGVVLVATASRWPQATAVASVPFAAVSSYVAGDASTFSIFFVIIILEVVTAGGLAGVGLMLVVVHTGVSMVDFSQREIYADPVVALVMAAILCTGHLIGRNRLTQSVRDAALRRSLSESQRNQRLSLARELHDSVATSLTSVVMRSQALELTVGGEKGQEIRAGLEDISRTSRVALEQLRTMMRLLKSENELSGASAADSAPPSLRASLDMTARELRAHGLQVLNSVRLPHGSEPVVDRAVLSRILTEMTSNAVKHAPERATVAVECRHDGSSVTVSMSNPVAPSDGGPEDQVLTSHLGLGSMTARARAAGGRLVSGPFTRSDGESAWRTMVTLPIIEDRKQTRHSP